MILEQLLTSLNSANPFASDLHLEDFVLLQAVLRWAHSQPHSLTAWYLLATSATHLAAVSQQSTSFRAALRLCKHALHTLDNARAAHPQAAPPDGASNGGSTDTFTGLQGQQQHQQQQQQQHMQVKLQCMMSQCQLLDRQSSADQALASAKTAVQAASGFKTAELVTVALQQLSR